MFLKYKLPFSIQLQNFPEGMTNLRQHLLCWIPSEHEKARGKSVQAMNCAKVLHSVFLDEEGGLAEDEEVNFTLAKMKTTVLCLYLPQGWTGMEAGLFTTTRSSSKAIIEISSADTGTSCLTRYGLTNKQTNIKMFTCAQYLLVNHCVSIYSRSQPSHSWLLACQH